VTSVITIVIVVVNVDVTPQITAESRGPGSASRPVNLVDVDLSTALDSGGIICGTYPGKATKVGI
jgi:hypothetical protein